MPANTTSALAYDNSGNPPAQQNPGGLRGERRSGSHSAASVGVAVAWELGAGRLVGSILAWVVRQEEGRREGLVG